MNYATRSVLEEMESELLESLEDRESQLDTWSHQAKHIFSTVFGIVNCYLNGFFLSMLMLVVLSAVFLPSETIDFLYDAQREEALKTIGHFTSISQTLAFVWMMFNIVTSRIRFISIKKLKKEAIAQRVRDAKEVIEIAEEVLLRHELISIEDKR